MSNTKFYAGCLVAWMALGMGLTACSSDIEEEGTQVEGTEQVGVCKVVFNVGDFPTDNHASSRADNEEDNYLKHSWKEGDVIFFLLSEASSPYYKLIYEGSEWVLYKPENSEWVKVDGSSFEEIYKGQNYNIYATATYAPAHTCNSNQLTTEAAPGTYEYLTTQATLTKKEGDEATYIINIQFERNYSRMRIHTSSSDAEALTVTFAEAMAPAGSSDPTVTKIEGLTPDENGNAFVYGTFTAGSKVTVETQVAYGSSDAISCLSYDTKSFPETVDKNTSYLFNYKGETKMAVLDLDNIEDDANYNNQIKTVVSMGYTDWKVVSSTASNESLDYFMEKGITRIDLSESKLTTITKRNFYSCEKLETVILPASLAAIGEMAFADCSSLTSVTCYATNPPTLYGGNPFDDIESSCVLYVPTESVESYKGTDWNTYFNGNIKAIDSSTSEEE